MTNQIQDVKNSHVDAIQSSLIKMLYQAKTHLIVQYNTTGDFLFFLWTNCKHRRRDRSRNPLQSESDFEDTDI